MPARGIFSSLSRLFCMFSVYNILKEGLLQFVYMTKKNFRSIRIYNKKPCKKESCRVYLGWKVGLEPTTFRTTI